jgi:cysteine-rich repeat protein
MYTRSKKVICWLMIASLTLSNIAQPVLATEALTVLVDDVVKQVEVVKERAQDIVSQVDDAVTDTVEVEKEDTVKDEIEADAPTSIDVGSNDKAISNENEDPIMAESQNCSLNVEICNGEDDDCDGLIDEGLSCSVPECGDGNVDSGEACDDGNTDNGDGCDEYCEIEQTGCQVSIEICNGEDDDCDGLIDEGLDCSSGPECGDGNVDAGEECDDGNNVN